MMFSSSSKILGIFFSVAAMVKTFRRTPCGFASLSADFLRSSVAEASSTMITRLALTCCTQVKQTWPWSRR